MNNSPMTVPMTVPCPPAIGVPPISTALIASSSYPLPAYGSADIVKDVNSIPATAAQTPEMIYVEICIFFVLTPDIDAALMFAPTANSLRP